MKNNWNELYLNDIKRNNGSLEYYNNKVQNRKKLISKILKYKTNGKIVEAGCGTGVLAIKLTTLNCDVIALDIDKRMLNLLEEIRKNITNKKIEMKEADIFNIDNLLKDDNIDIIYSVGVFEHYDDNEIIELLQKELKISNYVFLAIPTKYFNDNEKLYGNERFLSYKQWRKLIKEANGIIIEEFSCHNERLIKRLTNIKKIFRIPPIRVFVIKGEKNEKSNYGNR